MTLILAAMNKDYVVQVTDRRLTADGAVVDDEHEKCFSLVFSDFRFSVAFAGLATIGSHATKTWLMTTLINLAKENTDPVQMLDGLATELTKLFTTTIPIKILAPDRKTLIISIIGYNISIDPPKGLAAEISNLDDPHGPFGTRYSGVTDNAPDDWTWVGIMGSGGPAAVRFEHRIRKGLKAGMPAAGMRAMLEGMVRKVADDPKSAGTVGKQLDSILLHSDPVRPIEGGGSTMVNQISVRMPSMVSIHPDGGGIALTDFTVEDVSDEPAPMAVPKVHRNAPCPCGAGKQYKNCHGSKLLQRPSPILPGLPGNGQFPRC